MAKYNTREDITRLSYGSFADEVNLMHSSGEKLDLFLNFVISLLSAANNGQIYGVPNSKDKSRPVRERAQAEVGLMGGKTVRIRPEAQMPVELDAVCADPGGTERLKISGVGGRLVLDQIMVKCIDKV